jgi:hypothetical protein
MEKRYQILKNFESPTERIHEGVIKTENQWKKNFPNLNDGDCKIKTDWFKEVKENIKFKPEIHQQYWFISEDIVNTTKYKNHPLDKWNYHINNMFPTKKEAEEKLYAIKIKYIILDRIRELNEGWKPDWNNYGEEKYHLFYNRVDEVWVIGCDYNCLGVPEGYYFKSEKIGRKLKDEFGDALVYLFTE